MLKIPVVVLGVWGETKKEAKIGKQKFDCLFFMTNHIWVAAFGHTRCYK